MALQANSSFSQPKPRPCARSASRAPVLLSTYHHKKVWMPYCGPLIRGRGYRRGTGDGMGVGRAVGVTVGAAVNKPLQPDSSTSASDNAAAAATRAVSIRVGLTRPAPQ